MRLCRDGVLTAFQVDVTSVHESYAVGDAVDALELVSDDDCSIALGQGMNSVALRRMVLRARSVQRWTPTASPISSGRRRRRKTYLRRKIRRTTPSRPANVPGKRVLDPADTAAGLEALSHER